MVRRLWVSLLGAALLGACGPEAPARPVHLRLWCDGDYELSEAPPPEEPRTVFGPCFRTSLDGWRNIVNPGREPGGLAAELGHADGRDLVRLSGTHGGLHAVVPVGPDRCYVFSGAVRAEGLESDTREDFDGARFWLAEADAEASFEEFQAGREGLKANWASPSAQGQDGWQEIKRVFVTGPDTHSLHIVCSLAAKANVGAGRVLFADVRLEDYPIENLWRETLAQESSARAHIDPPCAQQARRVSAELGAENRPGLVLLPGERMRFRFPRLEHDARLTFGAGVWQPPVARWKPKNADPAPLERKHNDLSSPGASTHFFVRAESGMLGASLTTPDREHPARWQPFDLDLQEGEAELEFAVEGDAPLVIGSALVRTTLPGPPRPNLLLISIDTLRADHLGAYGYEEASTPHLDRLARSGLLCRDTSSQAPYTLPSHATLFTGQFPSVHGVVAYESTLSAARSTSLAELLARSGHATRAFTAGGFVNSAFGLDQGFDGFSEIDPIRERGSHYFESLSRRHGTWTAERLLDEQGFAAVERWLRERDTQPFFLFLHTYTVHDYDAPARFLRCDELGCARPKVQMRTRTAAEAAHYTPEMRAHVQHLYDAAVSYTDERLGQLLALLDELGLTHNTLIVVTADHGEEFFEHGRIQHGRTLYEELLRIPLIFSGPGIAPRVLERPAMLADVVPTVLARLGLERPENMQGVDLLGRDWPERVLWSEVNDHFTHKYALRAEHGAKTIHGPTSSTARIPNAREWESYDLAVDPRELRDLADLPGPEREAERHKLVQHRTALEALGNSLGAAGRGELEASTLEQLDELGYGGE